MGGGHIGWAPPFQPPARVRQEDERMRALCSAREDTDGQVGGGGGHISSLATNSVATLLREDGTWPMSWSQNSFSFFFFLLLSLLFSLQMFLSFQSRHLLSNIIWGISLGIRLQGSPRRTVRPRRLP